MSNSRKFVVGAALGIAIAGFALPLIVRSEHSSVIVYLLIASASTLEFFDIAIRVWFTRTTANAETACTYRLPSAKRLPTEPYALVMAVHNIRQDADQILGGIAKYKARTWIVDDCSTDDTAMYIHHCGWRCLSSGTNRKKPGAIKTLIERLPKEIKTVVVLDPDCVPLDSQIRGIPDLEHVVQRFQQSNAAACCPRIRIRDAGTLVSLQQVECEFAFSLGRKGLAPYSITSGVAIYDRRTLESALESHSLSVYAEDFEISIILLSRGLDIYFDEDLIIETDGKRTVQSLFSQRVGWSYGLVRVCATRWHDLLATARRSPWSFYNFAVYLGLMAVVLYPVKAIGIVLLIVSFANALDTTLALDLVPDNEFTDATYFTGTYLAYTMLTLCLVVFVRPPVPRINALTAVAFYLFYAVGNAVAMGLGYMNWLSLWAAGRRVYADHYSSDDELQHRPPTGI